MGKYRRSFLCMCTGLLLFCLPVSAFGTDKVTLQLIWKNQFQFAGYYVAKERGFYDDAGLDVTIKEYEFGMDVTADVVSQKADFGVGRSSLILESMEGKPVFLLSAIFQHSPFMLLAKKRADLKEVADLKGKRIMVTDDVVGMASLTAMLAGYGIKPDDYISQKHTFNVGDLISGNTDAIAAYISNEPYHMQKRGADYTIFAPKDHGFDFYSDILFTSQKLYQDNPQLVERFTQASLRGWDYAFAHIDEAVDIILKKYNTQNRDQDALRFEADTLKTLAYDRETSLGLITRGRVEQIAQVYRLLGFTTKTLDMDNLLYDPKTSARIFLTPEEKSWISLAEKQIGEKVTKVALNPDEQAWLNKHPVIRVHNEKDWPPFNYFEYGSPQGLSIDYMNLLAEKLGIKIEYVTGPSWNEFLGMVKRKELDVILNIVKTEDRMKYLLYTEPYIRNPNVIVSSQENPFETIEALFSKTVAFPKGFFYEEVLTKSFPQIKRLPVEDTLASMKAVMFDRADAALGEAAVMRTLINKNLLTGLQISGEVNIGDPDLTNLRFGVRNDWPLLQSALMKAMAAITPQEMNQIRQKWLVIDKRQIDEKDVSLAETAAGKPTIPLSAAESAWLAEHKKIRFTGDPDWLPQEAFTSEGQYVGIVADILDLVEARLGILFERVPVKTWTEAVRLAEAAEVDVLSETTSSERETMTFTEPYLAFPVVIIAKQGTQPITDPGALKGKRVAVVKGYGYVIPFRRRYPDLDYVVVETVRDGLMQLSAGEVDAFLSAAPTAFHLMSELGLTNLRIIGSTGLSIDLGFGVRKDTPVLVSILNKALAGITAEEKLKIRQKWVPVINTSAPQTADPISYGRLFGYGIAVFLILSLLAWLLIKLIKKEQIAVHFGSRWFRGLVLAGLSVFVLIVAFVGWYMLERNKTEHLLNVDENLRGVISVSQDRFDLWLKERISYLARLGRDSELVAITQRLLQVKPNKRALLASGALKEARFFFQNTEDIFGNIGFFIIDPDHVSIGSMRDTNLGTRNLISKQNPELLQRSFQGKVGFAQPMTSDVDLDNKAKSDNAKKPPPMFFIGPIRDTDGRVLAVMTLRVDPWEDFARVLKSFGGASRESYAFDRNGILLSSSRFEDQLRRIGLLTEDQTSALNVEIRDPGGNMVEGYRPAIERSRQPLTRMFSRALVLRQKMESAGIRKGRSSIESNIEGYSDYRGVPVFGAWLWNADLDIGLAVEVDVDEALSHYYRTRVTIFSILGFTLVLSAGAILFVLIVGERTSRALMRARDKPGEKSHRTDRRITQAVPGH